MFSGYDSQALALKYLGVDFEHYKTCEWAVKSIQALKDLHFGEDKKDYSKDIKIEQIKEFLLNKGVSSNYNDPMSKNQIDRLNEKQARTIYNNIKATHNLVNIQQVKGEDLEIIDKDKYTYIMTYSFPCQDLSLAGTRKGMSDTSTRSGMLWEVERILTECDQLPDILLMENVPQVHGEGAKEDFNKWQLRLEELGYKNYWKDLIATDYGIPQTRNRCFMISILGDYNYTFPKPIPLKLKLKDMLEKNVDEKYYLSDKMKQYIFSEDDKYKVNKNNVKLNRNIACSKTTREGWTRADTSDYIIEEKRCKQIYDLNYYNHEQSNRVYDPNYASPTLRTKSDEAGTIKIKCSNKSLQETLEQNKIDDTCYIDTCNKRIDKDKSGTITTGVSFRNNTFLAIKNATKKGYLEAKEGDGIDISSRMEHHRGNVQKDKIQTLTTQCDRGVVINDNYIQWKQKGRLDIDCRAYFEDKVAPTTTTPKTKIVNDLRIRKLTPKECFRLMGVKDEDYEKVAKNQSDSSLYHLAGDSIVVNVIQAIMEKLI